MRYESAERYTVCTFSDNGVPCVSVSGLDNFSVEKTLDCGQCFRFMPVETDGGRYAVGGVAFGRYVEFVDSAGTLIIRNTDMQDFENIWKHYLALDMDYSDITETLRSRVNTEVFDSALRVGKGIRILRQEPWECVCSFIISQTNNIPRIRKIISAMCEKYGDRIEFGSNTYYTFPDASRLKAAGADAIFSLRTGFRAKYIYDAACKAESGEINFDRLFEADTEEALGELCRIKGVGPKVASCALLFAFEKYDAFPVDVWVKKILAKYFPNGLDIAALGEYAGIAQQYLFYYERYIVSKR